MRIFYNFLTTDALRATMLRAYTLTLFVLLTTLTLFGQAPAGYYDGANGKTGAELKTALHNIIDDHKENTYDFLWTVLPKSDEDPNNSNNFILLYTGRSIPKTSTYPAYNREHVWAKSHGNFGETPPAGTDAHHLRPTDVSVNSDRGNKDFDNGGTQHSEATGCYYTETTWEPRDAVKGDVARMMFYMTVRYEGDVSDEPDLELVDYITSPTTNPIFGKLSTLLQWHIDDPVDDFERHRNEVVYSYQENRNPFIDHPEYVNLIWGDGTIPLAFSSSPVTSAKAGNIYNYNITVTGEAGANFIITAPTKPSWLSLDSIGNGISKLTGTPTEDNVGDNRVILNVTDGTSPSKVQDFIIKVASSIVPLQFTSTPVTSAQVGVVYTYNVTLTGNAGSTFTIDSTSIPNWLKLTSTGNGTATISGTPATGNIGANAVVLTGGDGNTTVEQSFSINVTEASTGVWVGETFAYMPADNATYTDFNWTGNNSIVWSAVQARTDLTINSRAICLKKTTSPIPYIQSQTIAGGCGQIKFKHQQPFTTTGGVLKLYINGNEIDTANVTTAVQTATFTVNISGNFIIKLESNGVTQIAIDDVEWLQSASTNQPPTINNLSKNPANPTSADNVSVSANVVDPEGRLGTVQLQWGNTSGALTNVLAMTNSSSTYSATIPVQVTGTNIYYRIKATDQEGFYSESNIQNYTVSPSTGIGNNKTSDFKVYPNPFDGTLNIEALNSGLTKVAVMDIIGQVVYMAEFSGLTHPINASSLKAGIYIVKVINGGKTSVIRVVKR